MKAKILFCLLSVLFLNGQSQIAVENVYTTNGYVGQLQFQVVKLSNSGYKYVIPDVPNRAIKLYNLNHSLFKTITLPATYSITNSAIQFGFISETLFNTAASDVEVLLVENSSPFGITIADETGTILFHKDSLYLDLTDGNPIRSTTAGTKLLALGHNTKKTAYVISLPGQLTCEACNNGTIGETLGSKELMSDLGAYSSFPNPSADEIKITYKLPGYISKAKIYFYSMEGKELQNYVIDDHTDFMTISKAQVGGLPGVYLYKIVSDGKVLSSERIIFK